METQSELPSADDLTNLEHIHPDLRHLAVPIDELTLDPDNARKHDARNLKEICKSLQKYTQRTPLVASHATGHVEKGNGTLMAAKLLGWKMIAVAWTDDDAATATAYGWVDNRTSDLSSTNFTQAGKNLRNLQQNHQMLLEDLGLTEEEAIPLLRETYEMSGISDEKFDAGMLRGRAITKISASERIIVDAAVEKVRAENLKALTEGACLELICKKFLGVTDVPKPETTDVPLQAFGLPVDESVGLAID